MFQKLEHRRVLAVTVTIADPSAILEDSSTQELSYTLARPVEESADYLAVKFELSGTADYLVDYDVKNDNDEIINTPSVAPPTGAVTATATFEPGETTVEVEIDPDRDTDGEEDETVVLSLVESDVFGVANGAAVLRRANQDSAFYVIDDQNQLATVDIETGCVHVLGTMQAPQALTDIAFTEDGTLFAITADRLYEVDYENITAGIVPTRDMGRHGIIDANALIDSRDGDFGSQEGDLFASGSDTLELVHIEIGFVGNVLTIMDLTEVFDIANALGARLFPTDYESSGDLDYARGDLVLSASRVVDDFDSMIRIKTPNNDGVIDTAPVPAEDPGEDFQNITGLAFDGNNMSFGFSGHTMLSVNPFTLNSSRELELTGRTYDLGTPSVAVGTILDDDRVFTSPAISDIADQNLEINTSTSPIGLTIGDLETAAELLEVTATSSNPTLVPESGITLAGTGADRTITITPEIGQSGTSTITVTVTDEQGMTDTETFVVTVTPTFTLSGSGETLSLSQPGRSLTGVEVIDIRGTGDNTLVLDAAVIRTIFAAGTINVISDPGDEVVFDDGWEFQQALISDGQLVRRFTQTGAVLNLTGPDDFTNPMSEFDVNFSGDASSLDALAIINELGRRLFSDGNSNPSGEIRDINTVDLSKFLFYDVTRDLRITALDALRVINQLARQANSTSGNFENELIAANENDTPDLATPHDAVLSVIELPRRVDRYTSGNMIPEQSTRVPPGLDDAISSEADSTSSLSGNLVDLALRLLADE